MTMRCASSMDRPASSSSIRPLVMCMLRTKSFIWSMAAAGRLDHHRDTLAEDVQFRIGHQDRNFDQGVMFQAQPRHLAVDPYNFFS